MHGYWAEFSQVALAHLLAVASPGPDFAIVLKQSLGHGRRTAIRTSLGIGAAILLHVTYSLLGLGFLLRRSEVAFDVVKYLGAAYLAWLGVQGLRAKPRDRFAMEPDGTGGALKAEAGETRARRGAFVTGFLTNALNPKATLFFVALFALVVSPQTPKLVQAGYGAWMAAATAGWFCLVAAVFTQREVRRRFLRHGHWIDRTLGIVFLAFAVSLGLATIR